MSILSDTIKRLDEEGFGTQAPASSLEPAADLFFVAGTRKRWPISLLLMLIIVVMATALYFFLLQSHVPDVGKVLMANPVPAPVAVSTPVSVPAFAPALAPASDVAAIVTSEPAETIIQTSNVADEHRAVSLPIWYEAGWSVARSGKWQEAFDLWEGGVQALPKDRMVIMSNSYVDLAYFSVALDSYVKKFPTFGIRQRDANGQLIYRLLVFPNDGNTREVFPEVLALFPRAWLVNASLIQERIKNSRLSGGE